MIHPNGEKKVMKLKDSFKTGCHKLIVPLFKDSNLFSDKLRISLASYTTAEGNQKPALVKNILKELWPEEIRSDFFEIFEKFESLLIAIGQRDHFLHQFNVFLLGLNVLKMLEAKFKKEGREFESLGVGGKDLFGTWLMASTTHDFGRPIAEIRKLNKKMSDLFEVFGIKSFSQFYALLAKDPELKNEDDFDKICIQPPSAGNWTKEDLVLHNILIDQISRTLSIEFKQAEEIVEKRRSQISHGYLGAIILARNVIEHGLKTNNHDWPLFEKSALFSMLLPAMAAVFFHDMHETDYWLALKAEKNLIAFLLCVSDQLQEWERSTRQEETWPDCDLENVIFDDVKNYIHIIYYLHHKDWNDQVKENIQKGFIEKEEALYKLKRTSTPNLGLTFVLEYISDCEEVKTQISIEC